MSSADVVIVGGGIEGCAAAWALSRRGVTDVIVCERATVGSGGTGKSSGVVGCRYGVAELAAMAWRSLPVYEHAVEVLGEDIGFVQCGYVVGVAPGDVDVLRADLALQQGVGVDTREVSRDDNDADGIAGVRLATSAEIATRRVAVVAGPWSPALLAPLGVDLPVHAIREQILVLDPGRETRGVPVLSDLVSLQYLRAESGGRLLVGNSDLSTPEPADPDRYVNHADGAFLERMGEKVSHRFPGLPGATAAATYASCYDVTPDFNPVIGATGVEGLSVAAGFSGHGFTLAPAVGELVADLVLDGDAAHAAGFRLGRFAEGDLLRSAHRHASAGDNPVSGAEPAATASAPARAAGDRP